MIIKLNINIHQYNHRMKRGKPKQTAPKMSQKVIERISFLLDTHLIQHIWQAFYVFNMLG